MKTVKARFVGGPWHNRVEEVSRLMDIAVEEFAHGLTLPTLEPTKVIRTRYVLYAFVSEGGAEFLQYVHESECKDGQPLPWTYTDNAFPDLPDEIAGPFLYRLGKLMVTGKTF